MTDFKRKITVVSSGWIESSSLSSRGYSWKQTRVNTIVLECGHWVQRRGMKAPPKGWMLCHACRRGEPITEIPLNFGETPVPGLLGTIVKAGEDSVSEIRNPIARALFDNLGKPTS